MLPKTMLRLLTLRTLQIDGTWPPLVAWACTIFTQAPRHYCKAEWGEVDLLSRLQKGGACQQPEKIYRERTSLDSRLLARRMSFRLGRSNVARLKTGASLLDRVRRLRHNSAQRLLMVDQTKAHACHG